MTKRIALLNWNKKKPEDMLPKIIKIIQPGTGP